MDQKISAIGPNYHQIFIDIIEKTCPNKMRYCKKILNKSHLDVWDISNLNKIIFSKTKADNSKFKTYTSTEMKQILTDQKLNKLTNIDTAKKFEISTTTLRKWKNILAF